MSILILRDRGTFSAGERVSLHNSKPPRGPPPPGITIISLRWTYRRWSLPLSDPSSASLAVGFFGASQKCKPLFGKFVHVKKSTYIYIKINYEYTTWVSTAVLIGFGAAWFLFGICFLDSTWNPMMHPIWAWNNWPPLNRKHNCDLLALLGTPSANSEFRNFWISSVKENQHFRGQPGGEFWIVFGPRLCRGEWSLDEKQMKSVDTPNTDLK